jgi:uncharacterized protein (TIGR02147 family)
MDFREHLQSEFLTRVKSNPRYSMRAFARFLQLDPATLSQYLRGKRKFSAKKVVELSTRLGLAPDETRKFTQKALKKNKASEKSWNDQNENLSLDVFRLISDWYHYAIFELVTIEGFQNKPAWIASRLDITASEVSFALERLLRLGLLVQEDGILRQGAINVSTTGNPYTAAAFRNLQAQVLEMGKRALEEIPMEVRDQSSMTMAISTSQLELAKKKIKDFRRELCDLLQKETQGRDAVYQLSVSFYPLTPVDRGKS